VSASEAGGDVLDDGQQLGAVVPELLPGLAQRERQAADLGLPDRMLAGRAGARFTPGQCGKGRKILTAST